MRHLLPALLLVPVLAQADPGSALAAEGPKTPSLSSQETAVASPDAASEAAISLERKVAALVDDKRAAQFVHKLVALGPRMGGTASGAKAAALLQAEFKAIGLPVVQQLSPKKWCHQETAWSVVVHVEGEEPRTIERAWPWGFSPAGSGKGLRLTDDQTSGTASIVERFRGTPRKAEPCAVVLCDGANNYDGTWPMCRPHPRRQRARVATFGIPKAEGARLRKALAAGKKVAIDWSLQTKIEEAQPITVVATLPTKEFTDTTGGLHILICAHGDSDSGGPGANDNASGVAIVMEMARAWKAAIDAGDLAVPKTEVRFAIWGSEIHSTRAYLESELGAGCMTVLNFDQAGFGSTGQRLHVEPDDIPGNVAFVQTAAAVLKQHAGADGFPKRWATNKSLGGTDSYVFSGDKRFRADKLPSVTMFTSAWGSPDEQPRTPGMPGESWSDREKVAMDYDVYYHSMGDTPENTTDKEPENMGWCARVGLLTLLRWMR